ncbi:hypothetical protein ASPBRDRAFT_51247 [Aspergillus brasiliensis CBS 101740]|uniref:Uncharacterized protein n=1 Tax=Aspergillus brasiliensis (strain CBS 101740 / IMI 381727 / IBT 21946) TaxID=767769 RepID=A0A1L9UV20_ASPBC|nr:hypothetical protein ASPBRDRAFT_51247 [Aspergillus brasiliensis CBS 101740]
MEKRKEENRKDWQRKKRKGREEEKEEKKKIKEEERSPFEATNASGRSRTLSCPCERNAGPVGAVIMCDRYPQRSYILRRQLDEPLAQRSVIGRLVLRVADPAIFSLQEGVPRTVQTDQAEHCIRQAASTSVN